MKNPYKQIQAYHSSWVLWLCDLLFMFPYLQWLRWRTADSLELELGGGDTPWQSKEQKKQIEHDIRNGATFLTNHRDIIMDAAWLSYRLRMRYNIRPYLGIGNNLLKKRWIEWLVRFNRCYVVVRSGSPKQVLEHARLLSAYIGHLRSRGKSIWLAQREGRAKDCNDLTQPAVLKMLTLDSDNFLDAVYHLNICPVSLSYQYDPCDFLKAAELQSKRDNPLWRKGQRDDLISMKTGIMGQKGHVQFRLTPSINHWIDAHRDELQSLSRNEQVQAVARRIDYQIHVGYQLFPRGDKFDDYVRQQVARIAIPDKDEAFLTQTIYTMYANIEHNHQAACRHKEESL